MAEKEERIYIEVMRPESPCIACDRINGISCFSECDKLIKYKKEYPFRGGTFSRAEAIAKMSDKMCELGLCSSADSCPPDCVPCNGECGKYAETLLKTLLGDK